MKKLFTLFLVLVASMSTAFAHDAEIDGIYYNFSTSFVPPMSFNYTATVTYCGDYSNEYSGSIVIPSSVTYDGTTYSVTSIGNSAFLGCSSLTSVTIPNSVTSIGKNAFHDCSSLTSVTINSDAIVNKAYTLNDNFSNIFGSQVTQYIIGDNVKGIGNEAFEGCSSLTSVTIPNSVTSIGDAAFFFCTGLKSVTIPNSVTSIGDYAFYFCYGLTSITIPDSVTSIGYAAFAGCYGLTSIVVENGNAKYDSRDNCNAIIETATNTLVAGCKTTTIPNSVTSIEAYAFDCCYGLTSITIPNSVTSIGERAFYDCYGLTSVTIPNSVTSIGKLAFSNCSSLTSITIPNSVTSIGKLAFYGCDKLVDVYCYATTPPATGGEDTFSQYIAFLYVPCESKKAYMEDVVWGNFKYIECISSEGIEDVQGDEVQSTKVVKDGQVLILRNGKTYTMQGVEVK